MLQDSPSEVFKVLLVEDSETDAGIARSLLGDDGAFELTRVERLSEAAAQLGATRFDAVLLDLMLPDSQGLATLHSVQDRAPELPIIVLSGFGADDVLFAREAVRGGAQDYLAKGCVSRRLMERSILTAIERQRLEQRRIRFSRHDELTGLPNRLLLEERFERAVARADRQHQQLALLAIEPDHLLRFVQDRGAGFGDLLLQAVASRLKSSFRRSDTLARTRERGFAALIEALPEMELAGALAKKGARRDGAGFRPRGAGSTAHRERRRGHLPAARPDPRGAARGRRERHVRDRRERGERLPGGHAAGRARTGCAGRVARARGAVA